jgi:hypothetical protein
VPHKLFIKIIMNLKVNFRPFMDQLARSLQVQKIKKGFKLFPSETLSVIGGSYWVRTSDPLLVRQML